MSPFPTHQNVVGWAGMRPGNEEALASDGSDASRPAMVG
jgi:hypothetical protein